MFDPGEWIDSAILNEEVVAFNYQSGRDMQEGGPGFYWKLRVFSPWEIKGESVIGWDHGADEIRRFRFDQMGEFRPEQAQDEEYIRPT